MSGTKLIGFFEGGLGGDTFSQEIMVGLANECMAIPGVEVRVGLYSDFERHAAEARAIPSEIPVFNVSHSLGASAACQWARLSRREIAAIFGYDIADNLAANAGRYGLTPVPPNVKNATSVFVPGGFLGGGGYTAEAGNDITFIENEAMRGATHVSITRAIKRKFLITEFCRRIVEA